MRCSECAAPCSRATTDPRAEAALLQHLGGEALAGGASARCIQLRMGCQNSAVVGGDPVAEALLLVFAQRADSRQDALNQRFPYARTVQETPIQPPPPPHRPYFPSTASIAATVARLTISSTVASICSTWAGRDSPTNTGPIACPPPKRLSSL